MAMLSWRRRTPTPTPPDLPLQSLLDSLSDVVVAFDHQQRILTINQCWEEMTGFTVAQTRGRPFTDFIHPEDLAIWHSAISNASHANCALRWFRILQRGGDIRWCEIRLQPMTKNGLYPASATLCDITPQVREEQIRTANHRSLQSLIDRLPAMLYRSRNNVSWTMEYVSKGCECITGYSADSLLNQSQITLGSMIHQDDANYVWETVQRALELNQDFDLRYRITQKGGREIHVQDKGRGLYSNSGMVLGVEGIITQIE